MAQFVYDASKYANGTLLSQLDWVSGQTPEVEFAVAEIGSTGRKYWQKTVGSAGQAMTLTENFTDFEMLLLSDFTLAEVGTTFHGKSVFYSIQTAQVALGAEELWRYGVNGSNTANSYIGTAGFTITKNTNPTGILHDKANAMRFRYHSSGSVTKIKMWAANIGELQADEPALWTFEAALSSPAAASPNLHLHSTGKDISVISIGTGADVAPYPNTALTITTPPTPAASNITATTADIDWT